VIIIGAAFAILIGLLALLLAFIGLRGSGGPADKSTAVPNLITGVASVAGGTGYLMLKKWGVYAYAVSVLGHFFSHIYLYLSHAAAGRATVVGAVQLAMIPIMSLIVLGSMERQRRKGILS